MLLLLWLLLLSRCATAAPANGPASSEVNARISVIASAVRCGYVSVSVSVH